MYGDLLKLAMIGVCKLLVNMKAEALPYIYIHVLKVEPFLETKPLPLHNKAHPLCHS